MLRIYAFSVAWVNINFSLLYHEEFFFKCTFFYFYPSKYFFECRIGETVSENLKNSLRFAVSSSV